LEAFKESAWTADGAIMLVKGRKYSDQLFVEPVECVRRSLLELLEIDFEPNDWHACPDVWSTIDLRFQDSQWHSVPDCLSCVPVPVTAHG
jgi:hypothetical protein